MLAQIQKATGQLLRQASSVLPAAAHFSLSCTPARTFSTEFVFDEENFRAPDLPHGLEVHECLTATHLSNSYIASRMLGLNA